MKIKNIVLSGGGIKGLAICGTLQQLEEKDYLKDVKNIYGSSIGAYIAFFLAMGMTISQLIAMFKTVRLDEFQQFDMRLLLQKYGFDEGHKFSNFLKATIKTADIDPCITFEEFAKIAKYNIVLVGTNLTKSAPAYFSEQTTPKMEVCQALRISGSYPIAFTPITIDGELYSDGAIMCPVPYESIPKEELPETLGIVLHKANTTNRPDSVYTFLFLIISCIIDSLVEKSLLALEQKIVMSIPINALSFDISDEQKEKLLETGREHANDWIESITLKVEDVD